MASRFEAYRSAGVERLVLAPDDPDAWMQACEAVAEARALLS